MKSLRERIRSKKLSKHLFCAAMLAYPLIQFLIFYLYAGLDNILLGFKTYNSTTQQQEYLPITKIFDNYKLFILDLFKMKNVGGYFKTGAFFYFITFIICTPMSFIFAFLIVKKMPFSGAAYIILYLPSIISSMVVVMFFKYFVDRAVPAWIFQITGKEIPLLLNTEPYNYWLMLGYAIFTGMPGGIIINVNTIARIPPELIESGRIDGLTLLGEFVHITLPLIYTLISVGLYGMFLGFFQYTGPLYALWAADAPENVRTFGYYLQTMVIGAKSSPAMYGYTTAGSILLGVVSIPIVLVTRKVLMHFDPAVDF